MRLEDFKGGDGGELLAFAEVEERLVEAVRLSWRMPDREAAWLRVRSAWPEIVRELDKGEYDARGGEHSSSDVRLRPPSLTRGEVAAMEEAFGWLDLVPSADRRLVGLVLRQLAMGEKQVRWRRLLAPMGLERGADGLRMRYGRVMATVVRRVNASR